MLTHKRMITSAAIQAISIIFLVGVVGGSEIVTSAGTEEYKNEAYGLRFVLPEGWKADPLGSQDLVEQERRKNKDAVALYFRDQGQQDQLVAMMVILTPADPAFREKEEGNATLLKDLKRGVGPSDRIFKTEALTVGGQPASQVVICMGLASQSPKDCRLIRHVTHILAPHVDIRIYFVVSIDLYPRYASTFDGILATFLVDPNASPAKLPKCQESDIQVSEHRWRQAQTFSDMANIKWEATLKNISSYRCLVTSAFQLLGQAKKILLNAPVNYPEIIESNSSAKIEGEKLINREELQKIASDRVIIMKIE